MKTLAVLSGLLALPLLWPVASRADSTAPAVAFVRSVGHDMPAILSGAKTVDEKRVRLLPFIARIVDIDAAARYCLGRYWNRATPDQQRDFSALFLSVLVNEIALWTGNYENPGVATSVTMQQATVQAGQTAVPTIVQIGAAPPAHITWLVDMGEQPAKILDVTAEGISLRTTERSDFMGYLNQHGGDLAGLITLLRQRALATGGVAGPQAPAR